MSLSLGNDPKRPLIIDDEAEDPRQPDHNEVNSSRPKARRAMKEPRNNAIPNDRMMLDNDQSTRPARILPLPHDTFGGPQDDNYTALYDDTIDPLDHNLSNGPSFRSQSRKAVQGAEIERTMNWVDIYDPNGLNLRKNVAVELNDNGNNDFLKISLILQCPRTGNVVLRGNRFRRTRCMKGMFDNKTNEVCWIQEVLENDQRPPEVQSTVTVSIEQVVKRRKLRFTNQPYPALSFRNDGGWIIPPNDHPEKQKMYDHIEDNAPLICRMRFMRHFKDAAARLRDSSYESAIFFLRQNECDSGCDNNITDKDLRKAWRGETHLGGAQVGWKSGEKEFLRQEAVSHAGKPCHNSLVISGRRYAAGDVMERGTVADLLLREDESGKFYTKLSGINDDCFVRSWLDVVSGQEFRNEQESDEEPGRDIGRAVRSVFETDRATPDLRELQHQASQPSSVIVNQIQRTAQSTFSQNAQRCNLTVRNDAHNNSTTTTISTTRKSLQHRYTFGDCFCGAGGMSRAAVQAGLRVQWAFDFNDLACYTYALNFHSALVYHEDAHAFATSKADQKVDICHMSPPCQFFSPAHTRIGRDDEANTASFFAVGMLLEKSRCRVATLEQTAGLLTRHTQYFHACVHEFTQRGFSVRWKLLNGADFGLPQRRNRLFMIASCPGEPLPRFPLATHTQHPTPLHPHLKPWTTITQALRSIPPNWPNHSPHLLPRRAGVPYSGDTVANCIMTSGGDNTLHPDGDRCLTHREFAVLQDIPLEHKFGGKDMRRQIGNAVPPSMGRVVFGEVVGEMGRGDQEEELERERGQEGVRG